MHAKISQTKIKDLALKEKQLNTIAKWSDEKIKATYIKVSTDYQTWWPYLNRNKK